MHFPKFAVIAAFIFVTTSLAAPLPQPFDVEPRAAAAVFKKQSFNQLSISGGSGGKAGNGAALANVKLAAVTKVNAKDVAKADLDFLDRVNRIANDAETGAYNTAIAAAKDSETKTKLQNGKILNKILKLTATVMKLKIQAAQGNGNASKLAEEEKKLATNIALDKKASGQATTNLSFNAST